MHPSYYSIVGPLWRIYSSSGKGIYVDNIAHVQEAIGHHLWALACPHWVSFPSICPWSNMSDPLVRTNGGVVLSLARRLIHYACFADTLCLFGFYIMLDCITLLLHYAWLYNSWICWHFPYNTCIVENSGPSRWACCQRGVWIQQVFCHRAVQAFRGELLRASGLERVEAFCSAPLMIVLLEKASERGQFLPEVMLWLWSS